VPIVIDEISNVIPTLPMAFRKWTDQAEKSAYELIALLSPVAKRNLFVQPDGSWMTDSVPERPNPGKPIANGGRFLRISIGLIRFFFICPTRKPNRWIPSKSSFCNFLPV